MYWSFQIENHAAGSGKTTLFLYASGMSIRNEFVVERGELTIDKVKIKHSMHAHVLARVALTTYLACRKSKILLFFIKQRFVLVFVIRN